ncbi:tripartite-type tricarboxylate transporter receptor subunit TctC [Aquabacter spiritensis]|uniref:Tripartite-type tricarboxylate transporter receptor subunit TctC n=2 Tax=Aquabacter spiritensis TaxID=933073 RepID=A0A4R3M578_9HYPH|nr:tripartite tricarboxylate transporter substrate binding protein [Aquabacter spiritensis]TCT06587.1 tripartite-type tricarboxylate transporter receptor subunit TctC [Aquabacter spiritensis]
MKRLLVAAAGLALSVCLSFAPAIAAYPERPITLIVPWGAGGGTDSVARMIASLLERDLGQPVAVVNRTGGQGVVGHQAIADATPDGYTIGLLTVEIAMMHWQGLTKLDPASYTPLALVNEDPAGLQVRADAPYKTAKDVIDDVTKSPGKYKASGTAQGGIWHLALAGMLTSLKVQPTAVPWVPSNGAAPGLQDLVAGGVQIVTCSLPEARALIEAGRVKSLAVMATERSKLMPDVPTLKEATGSDWTIGAWRGVAGPKGLPKEVTDRLIPALKKAYDSKAYQDFLSSRGFGGRWAEGAAFGAFMTEADASLGKVMKEVGLAK